MTGPESLSTGSKVAAFLGGVGHRAIITDLPGEEAPEKGMVSVKFVPPVPDTRNRDGGTFTYLVAWADNVTPGWPGED